MTDKKDTTEKHQNYPFKVYLGTLKDSQKERVYLTGFKWDCGWYWGGGYLETCSMHTHFDGCFLDVPDPRGHPLGPFYDPWTTPKYAKEEDVYRISNGASFWEDLSFFLDDHKFDSRTWWRIKDLYKQFYRLRDAAEVFRYDGHCTSDGRADGEVNPEMANSINNHIEKVIIPEILKVLGVTNEAD